MYNRLFIASLVFILYVCTSTNAEFAEIPSSVVVESGEAPPCRCCHTSSEVVIFWRVNGSPSGDFPDIRSGSVNENGKMVYTLTVPAEPQYNGAEVECLAVFLDGSPTEVTPAATIVFLDTPTSPPTTTHTNPPTTTPPSPPTTTHTSPPTTTHTSPPTIAAGTFNLVPSPLTVAVEQGTATFQCQHPLADAIGWFLNGISLNRAGLANISTSTQLLQGSVITSTLSIGTLIEYNQTTVACVATFIDRSPSQFTKPVTLHIQDTPKEVANVTPQRNYALNTLVTLWSPVPTLDINGTDPDIVYTVQLFRTTCGQNTLIYNQTTVPGSNVTAEDLDLMQTYKAVVFARNNVPGARNGPSVEVEENFVLLNESTLFRLARNTQVSYMSLDPFPSFYVVHLESLDGLGNNLTTNITVCRNNEMINLTMEDMLPPKSLWNASILAYGCEYHTAVTELSTHDLQNVAVNSPLPGQIRVRGDFTDGSTATGVLLIIYSLTNDSDVHYIARKKAKERTFDVSVNGLSGTQYGVSVFTLENQLPFPRVVTSPKNVAVAKNNQATTRQSSIEYHLQPTSTGVCVTCTFLDSSTTDCLIVVHQRINSSRLMNIESSHRFNRSLTGDTAYGCIEGVSLRQFIVGVAGGKMVTEPSTIKEQSSPVGAIAGGTVLGVLAFIVIVMVTVIVILLYRKKGIRIAAEPLYAAVRKIRCPVQSEDVERGSPNLPPTPPQQEVMEQSAEVEPLLPPPIPPRVVADGMSTSPESESAAHHSLEDYHDTSGAPPVLGSADNGGPSDPTYAQPVLLRSLKNTVRPPATTEKTVYDDIQGFQNPQGQHYAMPQVESTFKGGAPDDLHQVVYVKVKPHSITEQIEDLNIDCTSDRAAPTDTAPEPAAAIREPLTTEQLFSFLLPHASEWQSLGEALSLDDDRLDEIYTNNETEEACLQEMIELYMKRSDLDHSWEEIEAALQKIIISSIVGVSVQEVNPLKDSPRIGGNIMHVSSTHAAHPDHDGEDQGVGEIHGLDPQSEDSHNTSHQFSNDKQPTHKEDIQNGEQGDNTDSGYSGSQSSELESSDSGTLPKTEQDSGEFSDSSEERSESVEESKPNNNLSAPVQDNLDGFKSVPNLPYSQGSETFDDNPQCTLSYNEENNTLAATDDEEVDRRNCLENFSSPQIHAYQCCSIELFVANEERDEELFHDPRLPQYMYIPQESYEELSDYNTALIKQLGIGRENPSNRDKYQEPSEHNIDVNAGSVLEPLLTLKPWNCISSVQDALSVIRTSLKKVSTQKNCYHSCIAPLMSCIVTCTSTVGERTALWKTCEWIGELLEKICLCYRVSSSEVKCRFSRVLQYLGVCNFVPLKYPT